MNKILDKLPALVAEELEAANAEHPPFHSLHEGWAVLHEEIEETAESFSSVQSLEQTLWQHVKGDNTYYAYMHAEKLVKDALQTAAEAIQVAAMAQKLIEFIEGGGRDA